MRRATHESHQGLETLLDLLSPDLTAERYARVLSGFTSFYSVLEPQIDEAVAAAPSLVPLRWPERRKLAHLLAARAWFEPRLSFTTVTPTVPVLDTTGACLGALYVIEGASLGGQYIGPHVTTLHPGAPTSFFMPYGDDAAGRWKEFRGVLNDELTTEATVREAHAAAQATFTTLTDHFRTVLTHP